MRAMTQTTRQRILKAARQMIRRGSDLPIDELARRADVSVQTIYSNFGSKRGLILAAIDEMQEEVGLYDEFDEVFASAHGESALRRMLDATFRLWDRGWNLVAFTLRARRVDADVRAQLAEVDTMRRTHLWVICRRLDAEGRLRMPGATEVAADLAFALSTPTVYEELVQIRGWQLDHASSVVGDTIVNAIVDPSTPAVIDPPPDWGALGLGLGPRRPT
jgi:AcrR family transcriptional regulator